MCSAEALVPHGGVAYISSDGMVGLSELAIYRSTCSIEMKQFPFDEQNCSFQFGSWLYDNSLLELVFYDDTADFNISEYIPNAEWDLVSHGAARRNNILDGNASSWYDLTFHVTLRRRPGFYIYALIIPSLLLSVLTPGMFWIPPAEQDRNSLG